MAYMQELYDRKCRCGSVAKVVVFNRFNSGVQYCRPCGKRELARLKLAEKAETKGVEL
jgi:hypothetical protein